jgi:hypothetical protein
VILPQQQACVTVTAHYQGPTTDILDAIWSEVVPAIDESLQRRADTQLPIPKVWGRYPFAGGSVTGQPESRTRKRFDAIVEAGPSRSTHG